MKFFRFIGTAIVLILLCASIALTLTAGGLRFVDEIDCMDLYDLFDSRERILVFEFE